MLDENYKAFEIKDDNVNGTVIDGTTQSIAEFITSCSEGSIITIHTTDGEPFLIGLSKMFLYCEDREFLDNELIPCLHTA